MGGFTAPLLARAIAALSAAFGQPHAVIAHSVGAAMSVLAAEGYELKPERMALVGAPIGAADYAMAQGLGRGLTPASIGRMLALISAELQQPLSRFQAVTLRPRVTFRGAVDPSASEACHHEAHEKCFIANSVSASR